MCGLNPIIFTEPIKTEQYFRSSITQQTWYLSAVTKDDADINSKTDIDFMTVWDGDGGEEVEGSETDPELTLDNYYHSITTTHTYSTEERGKNMHVQ